MSQYSTLRMLGKLAAQQKGSHSGDILGETPEEVGAPQLAPSIKPEMGELLTNILGANFSKKYSPMDKS